ncbi:MAG: phosphatase PAP2 family protein [Methylobacterium radiotolerans]
MIDYPVTLFANRFANRNAALDLFMVCLDQYKTYTSVLFMSVLWGMWFSGDDLVKIKIFFGVLLSSIAGFTSRVLQHILHTHVRPYFNNEIHFILPTPARQFLSNTWHSFPSDQAAVIGGLVVTIWLIDRKIGCIAAAWFSVFSMARIYVGAHYLSDLIGGFALAMFIIGVFQHKYLISRASRLPKLASGHPRIFYSIAFLVCFEIATLFNDLRNSFNSDVLKQFIIYIRS